MQSENKPPSSPLRLLWSTTRKRILLLLLAAGIAAIVLLVAQAQVSPADLEAETPGVGIVGQRFMIAVPITNDGTVSAANVQITGATLGAASRLSPATFPVPLGTIAQDDEFVFQADFDASSLAQNSMYPLTVNGTYTINEVPFTFTLRLEVGLPPASPGSGTTQTTTIPAEDLSGGPFAHEPSGFGPGINEPGPPVPMAPFVAGTPTQQSTSAQPMAVSNGVTPALEPRYSGVTIHSNEGFGNVLSQGTPAGGDPGEPSGASNGDMTFVSFNWGAAYQASAGGPFNVIDPTTIFSHPTYDVCCDQHVQYVPKIGLFVWLQQLNYHNAGSGPGAYRLAVASPADIKKYSGQKDAWHPWVFTDEKFNLIFGTEFDFPSMSVGHDYLYISWDNNCALPSGKNVPGCIFGRQVVRIKLSDLKAEANPLPVRYTSNAGVSGGCTGASCMAWASFLTQDTGKEVYWAGHNGNGALRVFSWPESSNTYTWANVPLPSSYITNADGCAKVPKGSPPGTVPKLCTASGHVGSVAPVPALGGETVPPAQDWLFRKADDAIVGATRSGSNIWFAWNAAPNTAANHPQPYVELVAIDALATPQVVLSQVQIWNASYAYGLPSLATNACTQEIGFSLARGGGGSVFPNHAVGIWGDYKTYDTTSASVTGSEYGDYVTLRQNYTASLHGAFFDAFGYALTKDKSAGAGFVLPSDQVDIDIRHVVFGRAGACAQ